MSVGNILALTDLLLVALTKASEFGSIIAKARQEGRDVSEEEMDAAGASSQAAIDRLKAALGG